MNTRELLAALCREPELTRTQILAHVGASLNADIVTRGLDFAGPTINSVFRDGDTALILGGGWGESNAQMIHDDFATERDVWWKTSARPDAEPRIVDFDGRRCMMHDFTDGNYNSTLGLVNQPDRDWYISGHFFNEVWGSASRNVKPLALRGGRPGSWDAPEIRMDQYPAGGGGHIYAMDHNEDLVGQDWGLSNDLWSGAWHRFEAWIGRNEYCVWIDGRRVGRVTGNLRGDGHYTNVYLMPYFATDSNPRPQMRWYWDELYIANSRARVEIGNAPVYEDCTERWCLPVRQWDRGIIEVPASDGWVFVVDSEGRVSNGWEM